MYGGDIAACIVNLSTRWNYLSCAGCLIPQYHCVGGWVSPRAGPNTMDNWKIFCLSGSRISDSWAAQPIAHCCTEIYQLLFLTTIFYSVLSSIVFCFSTFCSYCVASLYSHMFLLHFLQCPDPHSCVSAVWRGNILLAFSVISLLIRLITQSRSTFPTYSLHQCSLIVLLTWT